MVESILYLIFVIGTVPNSDYTHPCKRDFSKLTVESRIEMAIGCSTVGKKQIFSDRKLEDLWKNGIN